MLAAFSSLALLPAALLLYIRGYWPEANFLVFATFSSIEYHLCNTDPDLHWCPNTPDVALAHDMLAAYLALTASVSPALNEWVSSDARGYFASVVGVTAYLLVSCLGDSTITTCVLVSLNGLGILWALYNSKLTWPWLVSIVVLAAGAGACRLYSSNMAYDNLYFEVHSAWHFAGGAAVFVLVCSFWFKGGGWKSLSTK